MLPIIYLIIFIFFINLNFLISLPINKSVENLQFNTSAKNDAKTAPNIIKFMRRFGYLDTMNSDSEAIYHESAIINAIKNIQKFGALEQNGILNNETLKLMESPRCGVPDILPNRSKRYIIGAKRWQKRNIKYFIANWSSKVPESQVIRDMKRVFDIWSSYSGLKFEQINNPSADIIIGFGSQYHGDNYPFDGPGNILGHAFYPYEMGNFGGDIHFDADENWKENSTNLADGVDFFSVALHELGHSLGLSHSPVYGSIMYPYYKGPNHNILHYDDILAMYDTYISATFIDDHETFATNLETTTQSAPRVSSKLPFYTTVIPPTFEGDYEKVEDHQKRNGFSPSISYNNNSDGNENVPDICLGNFDAVTEFQGSVYIFKEEYIWKLTNNYHIMNGYPIKFHSLFSFIPDSVKKIDAAYERFTDSALLLFADSQYWIFDGQKLIENSPRSLVDFGISENFTSINAAMLWPKNKKTYLFGKNKFWRFDEEKKNLDDGYPLDITRWNDIPENIDAAAMIKGKTYFFKDNLYWLYNNKFIRPERGYPRKASSAWLSCPSMQRRPTLRVNKEIFLSQKDQTGKFNQTFY